MKQFTLFEKVSLPKKRSRNFKPYFAKKELSDASKRWLINHNETNWKDIELTQGYQTKQKGKTIFKDLVWTLPGIAEKKNDCGDWLSKGCFNTKDHPQNKVNVIHKKKSCFRSKCDYCWLEKWLARESTRATRRIEKYAETWKRLNLKYDRCHIFEKRRSLKPIHVIISPSWKDKFMRFDLLKQKARMLIELAGIEGGLLIYHPFSYNEKESKWITRPHFHCVGYGWVVDTKKISNEEGWVIKNKKTRDSLHSTIYYQLSHAGVSNDIHSITWFGLLSYRAKYSLNYKVEDEEPHDFCDYCGFMFVECVFVGTDRPPDYEFSGLVDCRDWVALETVDEAVDRKNERKNKKEKPQSVLGEAYFNKECKEANDKADALIKALSEQNDQSFFSFLAKRVFGLVSKIVHYFLNLGELFV